MDKVRAAARQAKAMSTQAESIAQIATRLDRIELQLNRSWDGPAELAPAESLATAVQVAELATQIAELRQGLISLMSTTAERFTRIEEKLDVLSPRTPQGQQSRR